MLSTVNVFGRVNSSRLGSIEPHRMSLSLFYAGVSVFKFVRASQASLHLLNVTSFGSKHRAKGIDILSISNISLKLTMIDSGVVL